MENIHEVIEASASEASILQTESQADHDKSEENQQIAEIASEDTGHDEAEIESAPANEADKPAPADLEEPSPPLDGDKSAAVNDNNEQEPVVRAESAAEPSEAVEDLPEQPDADTATASPLLVSGAEEPDTAENVDEIVIPDASDDLIIPDVAVEPHEELDPQQCRICMATVNLVTVFKFDHERNLRVCDMIMKLCAKIKISQRDYLPHVVCDDCVDRVVMAFDLTLQCVATDELLRSKLPRRQKKARTAAPEFVTIDYAESSSGSDGERLQDDEEFHLSEASMELAEDSDEGSSSSHEKRRRSSRRKPRNTAKRRTDDEPEVSYEPRFATKSSNNAESLATKRTRKANQFECPTCGKTFQMQGALTNHLKKHRAEEKERTCGRCKRLFQTTAKLRKHVLLEHQTISFKCTKCWRTFKSASHLQQHQNGKTCSGPARRAPATANNLGRDLFKAVAPLTTTYWSDSFSD